MAKDKKQNPVVALLVADLHLSHRPPAARAAETDWYAAMRRQLRELRHLSLQQLRDDGDEWSRKSLPVICAGDVFDKWNPPPELINFAIQELPPLYAVPGQHDLAHHSYADIKKTGYWTLVEAGVITNLHGPATGPIEIPGLVPLRLWGFPWGELVTPLLQVHDLALDVAVIHQYVWTKKTGYRGAEERQRVSGYNLRGYDVAVFGDNHKPFTYIFKHGPRAGKVIYNAGGFFRRKSDEKDHRPSVGLLRSDGSVTRHHLDVSKDQFVEGEVRDTEPASLEGLADDLARLADKAIDFAAAVEVVLRREDVPEAVRKLVLERLENSRE